MKSLFSELVQALKAQNEIISVMLKAAGEHNTSLRNADPSAIMAAVKKQERLSREMQDVDGKRKEVQRRLALRCGLDERVVLSELLPYVPTFEMVRELEQLSGSLRENLTRLDEVNSLNGILAKRGMHFIEQLNRIVMPGSSTYLGSGELKKDNAFTIVDKTI